jgi:hypothetical protein
MELEIIGGRGKTLDGTKQRNMMMMILMKLPKKWVKGNYLQGVNLNKPSSRFTMPEQQ